MTRFLLWLGALLLGSSAPAEVVGHWRFDTRNEPRVKDLSPRGNDGLIQDAAVRDGALRLDGLGGHVWIQEQTRFGFARAITTFIWIQPAALKNQTVVFGIPHERETWTTPMFGISIAGRRAVFGLWGSPGSAKVLVESSAALREDVWTCLAATYDGSAVRLYIDGRLSAEKPHQGDIVRNGQPLIVGKGLGYSKPCFKGAIGELRLFNHALPEQELRSLFEQTKPGYPDAPAARTFGDGQVIVETHRNSPLSTEPWREQSTRLLEHVAGYTPGRQEVRLNRYGGNASRPRETATGFFRVQEIGGRQWLVDPEGCPYFNIGINSVREPRQVEALHGSGESWAAAVTAQLREAGFNGLGNGSSPRLQQVEQPLAWVRRHNFMFEFAKLKKVTEPASGTVGFHNRCMPVFYPDFEAFCQQYARDLTSTAQDPTLLGIMTDNELQCPVDLLDRYLSQPEDDPGRAAAAAWLESRKRPRSEITLRDRYEFIAFAFERYYRIVSRAIRQYDPHHLYLGSRIHTHSGQFDNPWFWKMLVPFHDVVSVNYYGQWGPDPRQLADWQAWSGKPVLFTEWYAKAQDVPGLANTKGAGWLVHTQEDRARYYQHFALGALELRNVVGWHWFKFMDDPKESVALDSAGGANKGMFGLEGRPYAPLLARARAVNREAYPLIEFFDARHGSRP